MNVKALHVLSILALPVINGITLGVIVGVSMLYIAVQHNPQGEFYDQDLHMLVWGSSIALFLSWLVPIAVVVFVVESLVLLFWFWVRGSYVLTSYPRNRGKDDGL
jgi:hypothetical protein